MRRLLLTLTCTLSLAGAASAAPIGFGVDNVSNLYSIDFGAGSAALIGATGVFLMEGLAVSASNQLFGTDAAGNLYSISSATGAATLIGSTGLGNIEGLDFNGSVLVATTLSSSIHFYSLNTSTGAATPIVTSATGSSARAMAIEDSNTALVLSETPSFQSLLAVDLTTGATVNRGSVGNAGIYGLDFFGGSLYGAGANGGLYLIDPATGATTLIGDTGNQFWIDATIRDTAVPEPASLTLLGTGLAAAYVRRKKARQS